MVTLLLYNTSAAISILRMVYASENILIISPARKAVQALHKPSTRHALLLVATVCAGGSHLCVSNGTGIVIVIASLARPRRASCVCAAARSSAPPFRNISLRCKSEEQEQQEPGVASADRRWDGKLGKNTTGN